VLVEIDVSRDDDPVARHVKTVTSFVMSGIAKENAHSETRGEFMSGCSGEVRVALTTEHTELLIRGLRTKESTMRSACGQGLGRQDVQNICGCSQSFDPVGGRKTGLKQQRTHDVVSRTDDTLSPPILG
jgi:hypothetical protein